MSQRNLLVVFIFLCLGYQGLFAKSNNTHEAQQNVILILDASGSMWGTIDGVPKINIARSAISGLLYNWDKSTKIGVIAYGHRRKGDCSDIQTISPLGVVNPGRISRLLSGLTPKGKTPLGASVKMAANLLKAQEEAATVILVSDGLETCGMDPCKVAAELKKNDANFKVHVVGFDVKSVGDVSKLSCIAKNTGGNYYTVNNASELNRVLTTLKTVVVKKVIIQKRIIVRDISESSTMTLADTRIPFKCNQMDTMVVTSKVKIDSVLTCVKIFVKNGGELIGNEATLTNSVIIVEPGGKYDGEATVYALVNFGGTAVVRDSTTQHIHTYQGSTKIINTVVSTKLHAISGSTIVKGESTIHHLQADSGTIMISTKATVVKRSGNGQVQRTN